MRILFFTALLCSAAVEGAETIVETRIVALGDSLTEGYGLAPEVAYPAVLEKKLKEKGFPVRVVNAGISGATSASGPSRVNWLLKSQPKLLILCLGANDALRGLKLDETRKNLSAVIKKAKENNVRILLVGMKTPPNYGADYSKKFEKIYSELAQQFQIPLVPFLLDRVGGERDMNLPDGIHPNEKGHIKIAETLLPHVEVLLK